jgi:hypothetical protein
MSVLSKRDIIFIIIDNGIFQWPSTAIGQYGLHGARVHARRDRRRTRAPAPTQLHNTTANLARGIIIAKASVVIHLYAQVSS